MAPNEVSEVAKVLVEARQTGQRVRELPDKWKPKSVDDANAIIEAVTAQLDEIIVGWKIAFVAAPRHPPFLCPMFQSRLFSSPAKVPLSIAASLMIEPEISFKLSCDLPPRVKPYLPQEVASAVTACASLEIVDTRFDTTHRSLREMIDNKESKLEAFADHITTGVYVTGEYRDDWQDFDFGSLHMRMTAENRTVVETRGGHAFVDPFLPCIVIANMLRSRDGLKSGQILVTGSFSGFFEVKPNEKVIANFSQFGSAEATFVD